MNTRITMITPTSSFCFNKKPTPTQLQIHAYTPSCMYTTHSLQHAQKRYIRHAPRYKIENRIECLHTQMVLRRAGRATGTTNQEEQVCCNNNVINIAPASLWCQIKTIIRNNRKEKEDKIKLMRYKLYNTVGLVVFINLKVAKHTARYKCI